MKNPPLLPLKITGWLLLAVSLLPCAQAQDAATPGSSSTPPPTAVAPASAGNSTAVTDLGNITVIGQLNEARSQIVPNVGATTYTVDKSQIATEAQGEDAPVNQVLLRMPGMAEDGYSQLHLRGEHANLQYRINDVLLPEGLSGFGQELDTPFIDSVQLITGSLPAQYGFRTAGIVDIQTKSGAFDPGGDASVYGGSYDTVRPSFEYGGSDGKLNYFVEGSFDHNDIGIENPTPSSTPIHDATNQFKGFFYSSYVLDDTSRITTMLGSSHSTFQIPDVPGQATTLDLSGTTGLPATFDSATVNENQDEQNYYGVAAYQKSAGDLNFQLSGYGGYSETKFNPDPIGDLYFNGAASEVDRGLYSIGTQGDASDRLNDAHTVRAGYMVQEEISPDDTTTTVFNLNGAGNPAGAAYPIVNNQTTNGLFSGIYLQDEWKVTPDFTINYGARLDDYASTADQENQISPRLNVVYELTKATTLHAGYARYFTPPPLEAVPAGSVAIFEPTSNAPLSTGNDPVKAERSNYFDAGITHKFSPDLEAGVDGYYKIAKNQLDDGFFGPSLIPSAFNYAKGRVYGVELTTNYTNGGFSAYANTAWSVAMGKDITSAEFLFDSPDLAYIQNNWVHLDHDQTVSGSTGIAYTWNNGNTRVYLDAPFGSGLREDEVLPDGTTIPNGAHVPFYITLNAGAENDFKISASSLLKVRLDVINATDNIYQLRNGTGIGVNAPQYGMRLGFFGSVGISF